MYGWILILLAAALLLVLVGVRRRVVGDFVSYHVINLDRSPDRLATFQARAAAAGLPLVARWRAIDTKNISRADTVAQNISGELWDQCVEKNRYGMIGATLSHRNLLQYLATLPANDADLHVIFEDDVQIPSDFYARWLAAAPYVPADYDVIYFGGTSPNLHKVAGPISAANPRWLTGHYGNMGAFAYAIRHGALPKMLDSLQFCHTAFDNMLAEKARDWGLYYCSPEIVPHDGDIPSTIVNVK
jgi:glycosyl transferase family 25